MGKVQVIGGQFVAEFGPEMAYRMHFVDRKHLEVTVERDPEGNKGQLQRFDIQIAEIRGDLYLVNWTDAEAGESVTEAIDFERGTVYATVANFATGTLIRLKGEVHEIV